MATQWDLSHIVLWQIAYGTLMFLTVTGNLLILIAIATTTRLRVKANVYIAALSVADFIVGLYRVGTLLWLNEATHDVFADNYWLCQIYATVAFVACEASIVILLVIAVDRFVYIIYPFLYERVVTPKRMIGFVLSMFPFFIVHASLLRFFETGPDTKCGVDVVFPKTPLSTFVHLVLYSAISLTNFTLYFLIFRKAYQQAKAINSMIVSTQLSRNQEAEKRRISHNVRLVKRMALVWGIFCILWTPYFVTSAFRFQNFIPGDVKLSFAILGPFNSAFNVGVYAYQDNEFRVAFKRMLCKRHCKHRISSIDTA